MKEFADLPLDPRAFARSSGSLTGHEPLARYKRIAEDCVDAAKGSGVTWSARGEMRSDPLGQEAVWLQLDADANAPMICQRCLGQVDVPLHVSRWFRFVQDEETAAAQDDDAPEDLLVTSDDFDLQHLIEDELVLALPLIARHEDCPSLPPASVSDSEFGIAVAGKPNPFAVLRTLKSDIPEDPH